MVLDELFGLNKHTRGSAAGVVDAAVKRLDHLDQQFDDAARCVELAAALALRPGELAEEVLVDAAKDIFRAVLFIAQANGADEIDKLAQAMGFE